MKIEKVKLGEKVEFLKKIESILPAPKNGKGFFIDMLTGRGGTGIVAGYRFPVSPITIGNMFIDNISLNVAAELPFDKGDARFVMSVSRPEAPFMIAVAPYAGAGHFGLIANAKGIVGFEASFQFGGGGGFAFGALTGQGRISVGIYVRKVAGLTELYGLFYAGGSARIACFGVGASLFVRLNQQGGNCEGEAIFTYSFSIGIKDIEFSVTVFKRENGSGKGDSQAAFLSPTIDLAWSEYSEMPAQKPVDKARSPTEPGHEPNDASAGKLPFLENRTSCMAENFAVYRSYFVRRPVLEPGRTSPTPMAKEKDKAKANQRGKAYDKSKVSQAAAARPKVWVMP